jgi:hypothetical protein
LKYINRKIKKLAEVGIRNFLLLTESQFGTFKEAFRNRNPATFKSNVGLQLQFRN